MGSYGRDFESYIPRANGGYGGGLTTTSTVRLSRASSVFSSVYSDSGDSWKHPSSSLSPVRSQTPMRYNSSHTKKFQNTVHTQLRRMDGVRIPQENVIIKAGFSLLPPYISSRTTFKSRFEPFPAHADPDTESARLSSSIKDFLKRSDHIEQDWAQIHPEKKLQRNYNPRDKMNAKIAIRSFQMSHSASWATVDGTDSSMAQNSDALSLMDVPNEFDEMNDASIASDLDSNIKSVADLNYNLPVVNELSAELAEEQATSAASAEKIEQEMSEKQQIESQLVNLKTRYQSIENEKQQLELDLAYSISEVGGEANSADEFNDDSVYKQRWERCKRELEMTKQRLKQREQDHLDQIMIMKKSLEKKCCDAWEESEEQKQIVAQLKRRIQKLSNELSDVKCLHQEEASRASLLEKKQRRFDSELSTSNMQLEKEKLNKDKIIRERDAAVIQKDSLFNEMQALKMELQLKETKLHNTEQELEELSQSGGSSDQVNALRKTKNDLQMKVKEQEEELDDMAGQVQTLESTKLRLEMQMEQMRKECKREVQLREEEIEDLRNSTHKKFKALECQLESEHEERTTILRAKQELERRVFDLEEFSSTQTASHEHISRLKKELKRTKALLKDSQAMMEQSKNDVLSKGMLRQLRHQLEDSESQRVRLNRAKQKVDEELSDALLQIEELTRRCNEAENEKNNLSREKANIHMQFEEGEENLAEIMKKYKAAVEQLTVDQTTITEQCIQISELEAATSSLKETISELTVKLETLEGDHASQQIQKRFQLKVREVETRLELETTTRTRLEGQVSRLKEHIEKFTEDLKNVQTRELTAADKLKKCERQLRESKDDILRLTQRESDLQGRRANLEKQLESADLEISTLKGDLKLAMQRIEDLTNVIRECDETTDDDDDSSTESIDSNNDSSILSDAQFDLGNIKLSKQNDESTA